MWTTRPIVVGLATDVTTPAVLWAAEDCVRRGVALHLVSFGVPADRTAIDAALGLLERVSAAAAEHAVGVRIVISTSPEATAPGLIELSSRASQIVIADTGHTRELSAPGSTAWVVAAHSVCPVVIWRPPASLEPSAPVVVGLDGSTISADAFEFALLQASGRRVQLVAVLAWSDVFLDTDEQMLNVVTDWQAVAQDFGRLLAEQVAQAQERFPDVAIEQVLTRDRPVRALLKQAATAQLLVVGSHGRGGFQGMLLGSVSRALVDYSPCPLAVVRSVGAGFTATGTSASGQA